MYLYKKLRVEVQTGEPYYGIPNTSSPTLFFQIFSEKKHYYNFNWIDYYVDPLEPVWFKKY